MATIAPPFYPIIYVRGFAMTRGEIEATTATPYIGFNQGATKVRQHWDGKMTCVAWQMEGEELHPKTDVTCE